MKTFHKDQGKPKNHNFKNSEFDFESGIFFKVLRMISKRYIIIRPKIQFQRTEMTFKRFSCFQKTFNSKRCYFYPKYWELNFEKDIFGISVAMRI